MRSPVFKPLTNLGIALLLVLLVSSAGVPATQQTPASASSAEPAHPTTPAAQPATAPPPPSLADARRNAWNCLTEGLAEKDSDRRALAIAALAAIGLRPDVVRLVEAGLGDKDAIVRQAAVTTLGNMKSRGSIAKLRAALNDDSPLVVYAAATALWRMNDKSGEDIFIAILDGDRKISAGAVREGLNYAHKELHDPVGLAELGAEQTAGAFLGPAGFGVAVVADLAKDKGVPTRAAAALLLADSLDSNSREAIERALDDKSWIVRAAATEALGLHGSRSDVAKLLLLLNDDHRQVRYSAAAAIVRLTSRGGA